MSDVTIALLYLAAAGLLGGWAGWQAHAALTSYRKYKANSKRAEVK